MRRLKRNEEGVSPVIATILMVAITVVLAATLWMMLDVDDGAEEDMFVTTSIEDTGGNYTQLGIVSMDPSTADLEDVEVVLYDGDDDEMARLDGEEEMDYNADGLRLRWTRVGGEEVDSTSRLWVEYDGEDYDFDGYEAVMTIDGYGGSANWDL